MNQFDCCGVVRYCCRQLGLEEKQMQSEEAYQKIEKEAENWYGGGRGDIWCAFTKQPSSVSQLLQKTLAKFEEENIRPSVAVDLGCGNSMSAIHLLQKGWKVIAVDSSECALENFQNSANTYGSNWIDEGQLELVTQNMETYEFPKNVRIILANNSFPYCDPRKIKIVWKKAYDSLEVGGRLIGNFFSHLNNLKAERTQRAMTGVWFIEKAVVGALLEDSGYNKEIFGYNKYWFESGTRSIEFVGRKI